MKIYAKYFNRFKPLGADGYAMRIAQKSCPNKKKMADTCRTFCSLASKLRASKTCRAFSTLQPNIFVFGLFPCFFEKSFAILIQSSKLKKNHLSHSNVYSHLHPKKNKGKLLLDSEKLTTVLIVTQVSHFVWRVRYHSRWLANAEKCFKHD